MHTDDETVDLIGYLSRLKRFWLPALVIGLLAAVAVAFLGREAAPEEVHHTMALVMVQLPSTSNAAAAEAEAQMSSQLMRTFVALDDVPVLTDTVSKKLNGRFTPQQVADMTSIFWGGGSQLLAMQAQAPTEQDALDLSNAMADALVANGAQVVKLPADQMPRIVKVQDALDDSAFTATTTGSSLASTIGEALGAGIVAALLAAFVLEWVSAIRRRRSGASAAR